MQLLPARLSSRQPCWRHLRPITMTTQLPMAPQPVMSQLQLMHPERQLQRMHTERQLGLIWTGPHCEPLPQHRVRLHLLSATALLQLLMVLRLKLTVQSPVLRGDRRRTSESSGASLR